MKHENASALKCKKKEAGLTTTQTAPLIAIRNDGDIYKYINTNSPISKHGPPHFVEKRKHTESMHADAAYVYIYIYACYTSLSIACKQTDAPCSPFLKRGDPLVNSFERDTSTYHKQGSCWDTPSMHIRSQKRHNACRYSPLTTRKQVE